MAFGLDTYWTEDAADVAGSMVTAETLANAKRGSVSGRARAAYIIPYETDAAGVMALRLLQQGFRVAVATKTMNAAGRNWNRGTFVVRITRNLDTTHDAVNKLANELGVRVVAANTGFADEGDTGVGGPSVYSLQAPKIEIGRASCRERCRL